ncbi:GAF and ANTAR domain-containing protein [Streptomyces sp. ODS28]|uniref:GAF and ANTAR domain-containing protein n=1 Tax=Streptomyces sp. ODS28 TaxID=3136688 RepID=UPI0031EB141E
MSEPSSAAEQVLAAAEAAGAADDLAERLTDALCAALPVDEVTMSLYTDTPDRMLLHASGPTAERLEELQFEVGEGPCVTAAATGRPVIVPDLHGRLTPWPVFGAEARRLLSEVGSVYAFPLRDGGHSLGSVNMLRFSPWDPDDKTVLEGERSVRATAVALLASPSPRAWAPSADLDRHWGETHRAAGVLAEHDGISVGEALARLRADAFVSGRPLPELAGDTLRRLIGDGGPPPDGRGPYGKGPYG